jgi:thiamine-phosphate pyrophosphorylase
MNHERRRRQLAFQEVDLYPVTSAEHSAGRSTEEIVRAVVRAGCRVVQLREKTLNKRDYFLLARRVRQICRDVLLICNDHLDVALAVGADGVHLGQEDLPLDAARALAPGLLIGVSTHNLRQALAAERSGADYVNIGPIFPTATRAGHLHFLGPQAIRRLAPRLTIPFTVMGGIKEENLEQLLAAGARRIALVTAVTAAPDPFQAARRMRQKIRHYIEGK